MTGQFSSVYKQYSVLPAVEQTKIMIIEKLKTLFDVIGVVFQNNLLGRKDDEIISAAKASVVSLYLVLKPKIIEHIIAVQKKPLGEIAIAIPILEELFQIDESILQPSHLTIEKTLHYADILNLFCHDYGITKITYFAGTAKEDDIYNL